MIVSTERAFILKRPTLFDDKKFIGLFNAGYKNFLCVKGSTVVSYICEENGFLKFRKFKAAKAKHVRMPLLILGMNVNVVIMEDDKGNEVTALAPSEAVIAEGSEVRLAEFNGTNYIFSEEK